jgi:hypothetical protein
MIAVRLNRDVDHVAILIHGTPDVGLAPGLRDHALDSPPLKPISEGAYSVMDGYQWILAAAAHAQRHTKQILDVIADDSFPA